VVLAGPLTNVVLWDFDGTLAEREGRWSGCLLEIIERRHPGHVADAQALRMKLREGYPWHYPETPHPELNDPDAWWAALAPVLAAACEEGGLRAADAVAAAAEVRHCYAVPDAFRVYDDAADALTLLRDNGWRHAIVSNHVPELDVLVAGLGLDHHFDAIFSSARTGYEKPNPMAFQIALDHLSPTNVWMVGDNPQADVGGAEALGIPALLVTRDAGATPLLDAARRILAG
jgi:putative hydrolase of the HAD superfamily